jgi:hypothetical protein
VRYNNTRCACMQITNVNAKGAFFFLREAGRTLSDGGKIITCATPCSDALCTACPGNAPHNGLLQIPHHLSPPNGAVDNVSCNAIVRSTLFASVRCSPDACKALSASCRQGEVRGSTLCRQLGLRLLPWCALRRRHMASPHCHVCDDPLTVRAGC